MSFLCGKRCLIDGHRHGFIVSFSADRFPATFDIKLGYENYVVMPYSEFKSRVKILQPNVKPPKRKAKDIRSFTITMKLNHTHARAGAG